MWTKTAPTEPGYYWYRADNEDTQVAQLCIEEIVTSSSGYAADGKKTVMQWQIFGLEQWLTTESMLNSNGEFWSEPLQAPE